MNEITAITPQVKDKTRCNIYVDGRFCCGLTLETVVKNRLKVGKMTSEEDLAALQFESEKNTAFDKALTHLSATRKTEKQIRDFLTKKGYLPAVCDFVVEKLRGYDFINDAEYAEAYLESAAKKKGSRLIRLELQRKGVNEAAIEGALSNASKEDERAAAAEILSKYLRGKPLDEATRAKAYRYLLSKGFDYDAAKEVISAFWEGHVQDE